MAYKGSYVTPFNLGAGGGGDSDSLEVLGEHIARLEEEIKAIKETADKLGDARAKSLTLDTLLKICGKDFYTEGAGAPTIAGAAKFAEYHDTTNNVFYKYNGSSWKALN